MISLICRQINKRVEWHKHSAALARIRSMESFEKYIQEVQPQDFLSYQRRVAAKRREIEAVLKTVGVEVERKAVLDIGPGHGESLDVFHERGASAVHFIEYDPFFFTYNRLKPFTRGFHANHFTEIRRLKSKRYSFVWVKGSIRDDVFRNLGWLFPLGRWLRQIDRILAPGGGAVICPYWVTKGGRRRVLDVRDSSFTRTMLGHGYSIFPKIRQHNSEPSYPITYMKVADG